MTAAHAGGKRIESLATTAVRDANAAHLLSSEHTDIYAVEIAVETPTHTFLQRSNEAGHIQSG